jgi:glycerol-3-phosphate dehydrogenase
MLTISGGKLTTARVMARQLVDRVEKALAHRSTYRAGAMPLPGADPGQIHEVRVRAETAGVPPDLVGRWLHKYGANAAGILDRYLAGPANTEVLGARGLTRAELAYCVAEEMVLTLADLMIRRTSTFFWEADGGLSTVQVVADALEELVPWEPGRKEAEVEQYQRLVRQHRPAAAAE